MPRREGGVCVPPAAWSADDGVDGREMESLRGCQPLSAKSWVADMMVWGVFVHDLREEVLSWHFIEGEGGGEDYVSSSCLLLECIGFNYVYGESVTWLLQRFVETTCAYV